MPCYHPIAGYRSKDLTANGKRKIVFNPSHGYVDLPVTIPCGQCIGCRLERSRQWAVRCVHEASTHKRNCFLTLTYAPENIPPGGTLIKKHFQDFMKRLRQHEYREAKKANRKPNVIRFFHCGEYGGTFNRPHYHAIIFGIDFADRVQFKKNAQGDVIHKSAILEKLWGHGFCTIGKVNFKTAAYVARYLLKKITGERAEEHYRVVDPETGESIDRQPEYITMSLKPGIGALWYEKFKGEVHFNDSIVLDGKEQPPPKFYDHLYRQVDVKAADRVKYQRIRKAKKHKANNTPERLVVRETVRLARTSTLKRTLE